MSQILPESFPPKYYNYLDFFSSLHSIFYFGVHMQEWKEWAKWASG